MSSQLKPAVFIETPAYRELTADESTKTFILRINEIHFKTGAITKFDDVRNMMIAEAVKYIKSAPLLTQEEYDAALLNS